MGGWGGCGHGRVGRYGCGPGRVGRVWLLEGGEVRSWEGWKGEGVQGGKWYFLAEKVVGRPS